MKIGIVGTGKIVQTVLPVLKRLNIETIYLMAREGSRERGEALCREYELDGCVLSMDELMRKKINTVYVATPNSSHYEYALCAINCGKHVIVEKPIVLSPAQMRELKDAARRQQVQIYEAISTMYLPSFCRIRDYLERLGQIRLAEFNFCQYSSRYDDFKRGVVTPVFDAASGGGALNDINVYNLYAAAALWGEAESVHYTGNYIQGVDTSGVAVLKYSGHNVICAGAKDCSDYAESVIVGEKGKILIDEPFNRMTHFRYVDEDGAEQLIDCGQGEHRMFYEFREFSRAIDQKDELASAANTARAEVVVSMLERLAKSAQQKNLV